MARGAGRTAEGTFETNSQLEHKSLKYLNLDKLEKVVGEMEEIDKAITAVKDAIHDTRNELDGKWDGKAADAYLLQFNRLNDDLKDFESGFKDIKDLLCEAANSFKTTDQNLFREMDQASKQREGGGESSSKPDVKPSTEAELESEQNAVLEEGKHENKDELYSTTENPKPADLTQPPHESKNELYSTVEDEKDANLYDGARPGKSELESTVEAEKNATLTVDVRAQLQELLSSVEGEKPAVIEEKLRAFLDELNSTVGAEQAALLIRGALRGDLPEVFSLLEGAVEAVFETEIRGLKDELISVVPAEYNAVLETALRDMKDELYSTMEAEYCAVFETRRRSFRMDPRTLLVAIVYAMLQDDFRGEKAEETSAGLPGEQSLQQADLKRTARDAVRSVMTQATDAQMVQPALRVRMSDTVSRIMDEMPALLGGTTVSGMKEEGGSGLSEAADAILSDYNRGSDGYREIQRSILTEKAAAIVAQSALEGKSREETASALGQMVMDQVPPKDLRMTKEEMESAVTSIGNRMYQCTVNRACYDAVRASGASASEAVEAVLAEYEAIENVAAT